MKRFAYTRPRSLEDARPLLSEFSPAYAGGVDQLDLMKEGLAAPERIVDLKGGALDGDIREAEDGGLRIGALATLAEVAANAEIRKRWPALAEAAGAAATPQVRNVATIAGNLLQRPRCWYFRSRDHHCLKKGGRLCFAQEGENRYHAIFGNDRCAIVHPSNLAPALVAHGARIAVLVRADDGPTMVPIHEIFAGPDDDLVDREHLLDPEDLVVHVHLPHRAERRSSYVEVREKRTFDWALAAAAVDLEIRDGRVVRPAIVLGQVAPVPWRAREAEKIVDGKVLTEALARAAGAAAVRDASPLSQNGYKVQLTKVVVARALMQAAGR